MEILVMTYDIEQDKLKMSYLYTQQFIETI